MSDPIEEDARQEVNSLMEKLVKDHKYAKRMPGDVSPQDMANKTGLSDTRCRSILNRMVENGELQKVKVQGQGGMPMYVYREIKNGAD
jgi:predicted transcriptional regulator